MSYDVKDTYRLRPGYIIFGRVEDGDMVVRARPREAPESEAFAITRLNWSGHLHEPAEPLHDSIRGVIARRMAELTRDAYAQGYLRAQLDIRAALGLS